MMHTTALRARRALLLAALAAGLAPTQAGAQAQDFPSRPLKMVVPFGAGTSTDIVGRVMADGMARNLGQPIIVENRAGAGGTVGADQVAKAPADGYTLVMGTVGTHAINAALYPKLGYDPLRDFAPVAFTGYTPTLLVVAANSPARSLADLKAMAARPGGVSFASAGNGTSGHLAGELLKARLGGEMVHVPYKEGGQAVTDVIAGQVQFMFYHPAAVLPHIKAGKLRALGASGSVRSAAAPDVPTLMEQGVPDFDLVAWFMLYAPAATPPREMARLREAARQAMAQPETAQKLAAQGLESRAMNPDEAMAFGRTERAKWADLVRRSGARVD